MVTVQIIAHIYTAGFRNFKLKDYYYLVNKLNASRVFYK